MDGPHPWPLPRCGRGVDNVDYQYSGRVARQDGQRQEGELMGMQPVIIVKFLLAVVGLAVFGRYYNLYVAAHEAEPEGHRGFTSLLVVVGELVILAAATLVVLGSQLAPVEVVAVVTLLHAPAGGPMVYGSIGRYLASRRAAIRRAEELARAELQR